MKKLKLLVLLVCIILYSCSENNNEKKSIEEKIEVETSGMIKQISEREKVIIGETESINNDNNTKTNIDKKYAEGEVLVIRKRGYGDLSNSEEKILRNAKIIFSFSNDDEKEGILLVQDKNLTTEELIEKLKDLPEVSSVEPNYIYDININ